MCCSVSHLISPPNDKTQPQQETVPSTTGSAHPADVVSSLRDAVATYGKLPSLFRRSRPGSKDIEEVCTNTLPQLVAVPALRQGFNTCKG